MNEKTADEQQQQMGRVIAKCWADETFKQNLITNTTQTLQDEGIEVPAGLEIKVVENSDSVVHIVLPPPPNDELSESELDSVAGGNCCYNCYVITISI